MAAVPVDLQEACWRPVVTEVALHAFCCRAGLRIQTLSNLLDQYRSSAGTFDGEDCAQGKYHARQALGFHDDVLARIKVYQAVLGGLYPRSLCSGQAIEWFFSFLTTALPPESQPAPPPPSDADYFQTIGFPPRGRYLDNRDYQNPPVLLARHLARSIGPMKRPVQAYQVWCAAP